MSVSLELSIKTAWQSYGKMEAIIALNILLLVLQ
jgi:hypothetical protein